MEAKALARFVRVSPQKARLVVDQIRGRRASEALDLLRFTRRRIAVNVAKLLRSAIANATERAEHLDVDQLWVLQAYVNEGPRAKRIRPAPMGRAHHFLRRSAHIGILVGDRAGHAAPLAASAPAAAAPRRPAPRRGGTAKPRAPRPAAGKTGKTGKTGQTGAGKTAQGRRQVADSKRSTAARGRGQRGGGQGRGAE